MNESGSQALSWTAYSDPAVYRRECGGIFRNNWVLVTHDSRMSNGRDAIATTVGKDDVVIRRGRDGVLHAFHNLCRHRGAPLLTPGAHQRSTLRCPYHGWTYGDDGALRATPGFNSGSLPDGREELSLFPVEVASASNMVFARCEPGGDALGVALSPLTNVLDAWQIPTLEFDAVLEFEFRCNWKLYVENWLESYHFPWMHATLTEDVSVEEYEIVVLDGAVLHRSRPTAAKSVYAGAWAWLWPSTAWNGYDGGVSIERIIPDGPERTRVEFTFLFAPEVSAERRSAAKAMCATVTGEDGAMCERVHQSVRRGRFIPGPLSPVHEAAIEYFHKLVTQSVGESEGPAAPSGALRG